MAYQKESNRTGEIEIISYNDRADAEQRMDDNTFTSVLTYQAGMRRSIILNMVRRDLVFTEVNYGAGIYRIMKEEKDVKNIKTVETNQ